MKGPGCGLNYFTNIWSRSLKVCDWKVASSSLGPVFCLFVLPCQIFLPPIKTVGSTIRQRKILPVKLYFINLYTYNPKLTLKVIQIGRNCRWGEGMYSAVSLSFHPQYHDWAEPPTASRAPRHKMAAHCSECVFTVCVCVCTLNGLNAEHKFGVWVVCHVNFNALQLFPHSPTLFSLY